MSLDAMKQALEALEQYTNVVISENDPNSWVTVSDGGKPARDAITALRAAIEQAQEPVAFDHGIGIDRFKVVRGAFWWHVLIGDSPTEHGKFRSRVSAEKMAADLLREFRNGAFVQHTALRQWQGLTDEERGQVINANFGTRLWQMAKDIEAKLKEKNT